MSVDRCCSCGEIIPEGSHVCINCVSRCTGCGWEDNGNCKACNLEEKLKKILYREANRIRGEEYDRERT